MLPRKESEKPAVIEYLFDQYERGNLPDGLVTSDRIVEAIKSTKARLGVANPANFLKDIVRTENANSIWPAKLSKKRITARQRYGAKRVFQFIEFDKGQEEPFPDRFSVGDKTKIHQVQSASLPFAARQLGRTEESWLTQIVVNLRLIETQLSIFSPLRERVRDVTHLQMGMKTQPEIDAVFLASYGASESLKSETNLHMLVTCEAKQIRQRILEDQIREQVAIALQVTSSIQNPNIDAVKPIALKVVDRDFRHGAEKAIYIVEFRHVERKVFNAEWGGEGSPEEQLYSMPLEAVSSTIFRISPRIAGLNDNTL